MAMFLSGIQTIIIMRIGQWSNEAFLEYIREQVEQLTLSVSQRILQYKHFHTTASNTITDRSVQPPIFIEKNKSGGEPIPIDHAINFTKISLGKLEIGAPKGK
jgi:hypothetical protein